MELRLDSAASPARARSLFTVRAAISLAVSRLSPRSRSPSLMCSYWRSRLLLQASLRHADLLVVSCHTVLRAPVSMGRVPAGSGRPTLSGHDLARPARHNAV